MNKKKLSHSGLQSSVTSVMAALLCIVIGMAVGFLVLLAINPAHAWGDGFVRIIKGGFHDAPYGVGKELANAAPLIMTGLSVAFAFKTGLFNIGASGQYTMGAFFSLLCAIQFQMPWYVCLLAGAVGGAIWGVFPGLFKAYFNVNEVITAIMFNWIGMYLVNLLLANMPDMLASGWGASNSDRTAALNVANPGAILPRGPFAALFGNSSWINISIIITIIFAILVWVILQKTTFGYELKACGLSRDAAQYAGINSKRNIVLSMVISGALSGIGGAIYYLAGTGQYVLEKSILGMGFNGIPVALLASSNPIGTIFASLFISYIQVGGAAMQPAYSSETFDIVIAVIIYLAAFALLISLLTSLSGLIFVPLLLGAVWLKYKVGRMDGEAWEHYFQSVSTVGLLLRGAVLLLLALGLTALLSWPLFALLGFPMPERLALLFFLIGGADLFRKLSQERDELVRKLLRLKLPGGRKGVTEQ